MTTDIVILTSVLVSGLLTIFILNSIVNSRIKNKISENEYHKIRDYVGDCYHVMGLLCDCAPIKLIAGNVDSIIENLNA